MKYLVRLTDAVGGSMVLLTLGADAVTTKAIDFVFDVLAERPINALLADGIVAEAHVEDFKFFRQGIFEEDDQGLLIRDGISFTANGKDLDPDSPFDQQFVESELEGMKYLRLDLSVSGISGSSSFRQAPEPVFKAAKKMSQEEQIESFARIMLLHQLYLGVTLDVTKEYPDWLNVIAWAERESLIEIDVKRASYVLTEKGKAKHDGFVAEAQDLIRRYDVYGDVDIDSSGSVRFDTGLGQDLRVAVFEANGVDPFAARFLLGINDGEWDKLPTWMESALDPTWYQEQFKSVEKAPGVDQIGRDKLNVIQDAGKAVLRRELDRGVY